MTDTPTQAPETGELEKLLAEATPGPWRLGSWQDNVFGTGPNDEWLTICRVKRDDAPISESRDHIDARLIALTPTIAADLIRLRAEVATLRASEARMREALALASNRLHRCSVDYDTGTYEFIETGEWAAEARAALQGEQPRLTEYERKVAQMKEDFPNGV